MLLRPYKGIHPRIGQRVFLAENASIIGDVELADDVSIWYGTVLRGDVHFIRVGARSNIQDNCTVHVTNGKWPTILHEEVTIGHGVVAHGCVIERGSLIGIGSRLLDGSVIGEQSIIGAGALVTQGMKVPPRSLVLGFPAKVVRSLTAEELAHLSTYATNYLEYKETYLAESGEGERKS
jgi:carbonic anhydrase/acetyltransferase-like protein (isoleucine patch superfamily)